MNLSSTCPDIPDDWRGGFSAVSRVLGLDRKTLMKYAAIGRSGGGLDYSFGTNGRKYFSGREVKRFWHIF